MCAKWNNEQRATVLIDRLGTLRRFDESGKFDGFEGFEFGEYLSVLHSWIDFDVRVPERMKMKILREAVFSEAVGKKFTVQGILGKAKRGENSFLNLPKQQYVLATNLSIPQTPFKKKLINSTDLVFQRSLQKKFDQQSIQTLRQRLDVSNTPDQYTSVRIPILARNENVALTKAMDSLDLLRGIWNYNLNSSVIFRSHIKPDLPINRITLGPFHTLHHPNGSLVTKDILWYEPDYVFNIHNLSREWKNLLSFERSSRKYLSHHLYKKDVEDLLRRYTRALDYRDSHVSFLELWGTLEKLTATEHAKYDSTVARTAFLFADADFEKQVLEHLRSHRNTNVHTGRRTDRIETILFQLMKYVHKLLNFHIVNHFKFSNLKEAAEFLDCSRDVAKLRARVSILEKAIDFQT